MTQCTTYRDELLEAAPDELAGVAPTALADHVRDCARCRATARLLLDEHARLGSALAAFQPARSADAAAADVLGRSFDAEPIGHRRRERLQRFAAAVFPVATAAGLAVYVVYGRTDPVPTPMPVAEREIDHVRITAPPGTGTVVLTTNDPNITFAWIGREIMP